MADMYGHEWRKEAGFPEHCARCGTDKRAGIGALRKCVPFPTDKPEPRAVRPQSLAREGYERAWHDKRSV